MLLTIFQLETAKCIPGRRPPTIGMFISAVSTSFVPSEWQIMCFSAFVLSLPQSACLQLCCWAGPRIPCGGFTVEHLTSLFTHQAASLTWQQGGLGMVFSPIPACCQEGFPLQLDHPPGFGEHSTVAGGHFILQLLQLWIQHQRLFSHSSDWWD